MTNNRVRRFWIAAAVVAAVAAPLGWSYYASQQVPTFYEEALEIEPNDQRVASTEMFNNTMALVQDVRKAGQWQATFTQPQINGWMAVDLKENHAELLGDDISEPRLSLEDGRATLAYRYKSSTISTVVSVVFDVYLAKDNVVAVRIERVRAGDLPVPLKNVLDAIADAAIEAGWWIEWRQQSGDPVALVHVPEMRDESDSNKRLHLENIEIRAGSVSLAGRTEVTDARQWTDHRGQKLRLRVADHSGVKATRKR